MKRMMYVLCAIATVFTLFGANDKQIPTFEFWNKTKDLVRIRIDRSGKENEIIWVNPNKYISKNFDISDPTTLYINYLDTNEPDNWTEKIIFNPGKTMYVRLKEEKGEYIFGPQTGPLKGLRGITERKYPLKNNVKKEGIDYLRINMRNVNEKTESVAKPASANKNDPWLALPGIKKAIDEKKVIKVMNKKQIITLQYVQNGIQIGILDPSDGSSKIMPLPVAYLVLDIPENSSLEDIKKTYKQLSLKWHPDKHAGESEKEKERAAEVFKIVDYAYKRINNKF